MKYLVLLLLLLTGCSSLPRTKINNEIKECIRDFVEQNIAIDKAYTVCNDIYRSYYETRK